MTISPDVRDGLIERVSKLTRYGTELCNDEGSVLGWFDTVLLSDVIDLLNGLAFEPGIKVSTATYGDECDCVEHKQAPVVRSVEIRSGIYTSEEIKAINEREAARWERSQGWESLNTKYRSDGE